MTIKDALRDALGSQTFKNLPSDIGFFRSGWKARNSLGKVILADQPRSQPLINPSYSRFWLLAFGTGRNRMGSPNLLEEAPLYSVIEHNDKFWDVSNRYKLQIKDLMADDWNYRRFAPGEFSVSINPKFKMEQLVY